MPVRARVLIVLTLAFVGCASKAEESGKATTHDASAPEEVRLIKLTLFPFWEIPEDENGFGTPVPLDGVKVCVKSKRPYGAAWKDFVDTQGPCTITTAGENVVLEEVPGGAELLVTAEKDGNRPSVFAVTTWEWDLDTTLGNTDGMYNSLRRSDAKSARIDPAVTVLPGRGDLTFWEGGGTPFLAGVHVVLEPALGEGPYYFKGGKYVSGASETLPGDAGSVRYYAGASFFNLPEDEYIVRASHPRAFCSVEGAAGSSGDPVYGYARAGGIIVAPVLDGYSTPAIRALCVCLDAEGLRYPPANLDCSPITDAGASTRGPLDSGP